MSNFTPTLGNYTELQPFRFWCQKVLPLVYDDSLSYYELLCKVVDYLNTTMADVDTLHDDVTNIATALAQLEEYVNEYFDNLDLTAEINDKLDEMASDGTLSAMITPLVPDIVTDWLDDHFIPSAPAIDNTLTISGAAADSKVTGDYIFPMHYTYTSSRSGVPKYNGYYSNAGAFVPNNSYYATGITEIKDNYAIRKTGDVNSTLILYDINKNKLAAYTYAAPIEALLVKQLYNAVYFAFWSNADDFEVIETNYFNGYLANNDTYVLNAELYISNFIDLDKLNTVRNNNEDSVTVHYYDSSKYYIGTFFTSDDKFVKLHSTESAKYARYFCTQKLSAFYDSFDGVIEKVNGFIDNNGAFNDNNSYICSGFINVDKLYSYTLYNDANYHVHLYDEDLEQILTYTITEAGTYFVKQACKYVRIWCAAEYDFDVNLSGRLNFLQFPVSYVNEYITNTGGTVQNKNYHATNYLPCGDIKYIKSDNGGSEYNIGVDYFNEDLTFAAWETVNRSGFTTVKPYAYCRIWCNNLIDFDVIRKTYKKNVVVFGDSWSDNNPDHTSYVKWTSLIKDDCDITVYAQNGSSISGNTPAYMENGNVKGQVDAFLANPVPCDTVIFFGGINDYRNSVTKETLLTDLLSRITEVKTAVPSARIIYISNQQIFIPKNQIDYFNYVVDGARLNGVEAFTSFGWIYRSNFISDNIHPNNDGYKRIYANIKSILNGGTPETVVSSIDFASTADLNGVVITLKESWINNRPVYVASATVYTAGLNKSYNYSFSSGILSCYPTTLLLYKKTPAALPPTFTYFELNTSAADYAMITTAAFTIKTPSANAGTYETQNY